ncbi:MAG: class I SAM-dependent methyltransferase [Butyrivibrio sp.]|nr:class I SAM-dependent methyltransferase [Butyrivibrio sp.]
MITFLSTNGITQIITFSELDSFGKDNDYKRNNWVKEQLSKLPSGFRLLDAGAGECQYKKYFSHLNYVSQDFCEYDGSGNNGLQTGQWNTTHIDIVSDITSIPEEDSSFDAILCTEVFEHLENPEMAIKEFSRLLKRGGVLIATAPFCSLTHFAPYHFATGFNVFWYQRILSKYDFEITCCEANGNYYSYLAQELRRIPYVASRYSGQSISISEEINIRKVIALLEKLDKSDTDSSESLCFGYHVVAQKV